MKLRHPLPLIVLTVVLAEAGSLAQQTAPQPRRPGGSGRAGEPIQEKAPLARSESEKRMLAVLDDLDKNQRAGTMSVPALDGRLLRVLTEATGAKNVVEIGTSVGYSGIWFCLGLEATGGHLTTFDIDEGRMNRARANFERAGVTKRITTILGDAHAEVSRLKDPIDILFLDADKEGYLDYFNKLLPLVRPGGLIIAHNMNTRQADPRFVEAITANPQFESLFLNKELTGIGVTLKKR